MRRTTLRTLTLALILPIAACDGGTGVGGPGTLSLLLTDAAGDFTQAVVTIERVELVGDGEPVVLMDEPLTTDLLTLSNDVATLVEDVTVEAGVYSQLRFIVPEACIGVEQADGSETIYASSGFEDCGPADGDLQLPSFGQSGVKVTLPGGSLEIEGEARILLVDFDVSQSFGHVAGDSGQWVMHPVVHADDVSLTGSITVELTAADSVDLEALEASLGDFEAGLDTEPDPIAFTDEDEDGVYTATFLFLMPGDTYEASVDLQEGVTFPFTLDPTSPQSLTLGDGENAAVAFEVTSAGAS